MCRSRAHKNDLRIATEHDYYTMKVIEFEDVTDGIDTQHLISPDLKR